MGIGATLIKDFKLKDSSFKEIQFLTGKKSIVESVGRGNCDLIARDIATITSQGKIMFAEKTNYSNYDV